MQQKLNLRVIIFTKHFYIGLLMWHFWIKINEIRNYDVSF
jgi:hypothetical protein